MSDKEILNQPISEEEMADVSGGEMVCMNSGKEEIDRKHCVYTFGRDIYEGGFPNCAATVEEGSWCKENDACTFVSVDYLNMKNNECVKAWR